MFQDPGKLDITEDIPWSEPGWLRSLESPYYNESHRQLQQMLRSYVNTNILPYALGWEESGHAPSEEAEKFCMSGIPFEDVPNEFRPGKLVCDRQPDAFHLLIRTDELARVEGGVTIALAGASLVAIPPIINDGTEKQKAEWLPGLFTRKTSFCLGVTEPCAGSDVAGIQTSAALSTDGKFYRVNGMKKWVTGALWASHMTTAVRTGGLGTSGISVLVIPLNAPGVVVEKIQNSGHNAGGASFVYLEDVEVPATNLIGEENDGFSIIMRNFNRERFILAVQCNRKSRTCLTAAYWYAMRRSTFGKPLIQNQIIRQKLASMVHRIEAHWAWLEQICYQVQHSSFGWQSDDIASTLALVKVQGGQLLEHSGREAQQVFGAAGYQKGGPGAAVEQINRDLRMLVLGGGSEEILMDLAIRLSRVQARL